VAFVRSGLSSGCRGVALAQPWASPALERGHYSIGLGLGADPAVVPGDLLDAASAQPERVGDVDRREVAGSITLGNFSDVVGYLTS
jgi:hypothetical protein